MYIIHIKEIDGAFLNDEEIQIQIIKFDKKVEK